MRRSSAFVLIGVLGMVGCAGDETAQGEMVQDAPQEVVFGPADGM